MPVPAPPVMQKHPHVTLERIEKFLSPIYFADVNLCADLIKERSQGLPFFFLLIFSSLSSCTHTHASCFVCAAAVSLTVRSFKDRVPFTEAITGEYTETKVLCFFVNGGNFTFPSQNQRSTTSPLPSSPLVYAIGVESIWSHVVDSLVSLGSPDSEGLGRGAC